MQTDAHVEGTVAGLWRYPVKSMMGEELNATEVTERGVVGDRHYAVVDPSTGKVAGAKNPRAVRVFRRCCRLPCSGWNATAAA